MMRVKLLISGLMSTGPNKTLPHKTQPRLAALPDGGGWLRGKQLRVGSRADRRPAERAPVQSFWITMRGNLAA